MGLLSTLRGSCPPPFCPCVFSQASLPLSRARVVFANTSARSSGPDFIHYKRARDSPRALCDGLWLALSAAPSRFTAASSSDEGRGQTRAVGVAWAPRQPCHLPVCQPREAAEDSGQLGHCAGHCPASWSGCAARAGGSPGPEVSRVLGTEANTWATPA